jgi:hypothetical protein
MLAYHDIDAIRKLYLEPPATFANLACYYNLSLEFYPSSFVSTVTFPSCFYLSEEKGGTTGQRAQSGKKIVNTCAMILGDCRTIIM